MISTLFLSAIVHTTLSYAITFDKTDPIASHPDMMSLVNKMYERRRGLDVANSALSPEERADILKWHNEARSQTARGLYEGSGRLLPAGSNIAELKYSLNLEKVATDWSGNCVFQHRGSGSSCKGAMASARNSGVGVEWDYDANAGCGENLYGSGAEPAMSVMFGGADYGIKGGITDSWCINEAKTWTYGMSMGSAGHYTQVIWDTTRYVGCGFKRCNSAGMKMMFTCNYYPAGNGFFGDRTGPYARGTACSACPADIPDCTTGENAGLCTDNGSGTPSTPSPVAGPVTPSPVATPSPIAPDDPTRSPVTAAPVATPSPVTPAPVTTTGNCLIIAGFTGSFARFNGQWTADGDNAWRNRQSWKLSNTQGYFGFHDSSESWPDWDYGWCGANDISLCSNVQWATTDDRPTFSRSQCGDSGGSDTTAAPTTDDSNTDAYACVKIDRLDRMVEVGGNYVELTEGTWIRDGTYNDYPVWKWSEGSYFLYAMDYYNWYTISPRTGAMEQLQSWCGSSQGTNIDIFECSGRWGGDTNCAFRPCNSDAFTFAPCLDSADEYVCFYENSTVSEPITFGIYESEGCINDEAVYRYTHEDEGIFWYIHYDSEILMWKITADAVENEALYVCEEDTLAECGEGEWIKMVSGYGIMSYEALETAKIEVCESNVGGGNVSHTETTVGTVMTVIAVFLCIFAIIALVICCRNRKLKGNVAFTHKSEIVQTNDKVPMTTNADTVGDTVNVGTDDEMDEP